MYGIYNCIELTDDLVIGGVVPESAFARLAADGTELVVNLLPRDSQYALANEAAVVTALGMIYVSIPVDFRCPTAEEFTRFCTTMNESEQLSRLVHCAANFRVSTFVALWGERDLGWSRAESDALIARAWQPDEVWIEFIDTTRASFATAS